MTPEERIAQLEADYSMLRALARRMFAENTTDQDALNLWNIAATVDHPGAALNIRWNRAKAVIEAVRINRRLMPLQVRTALDAYDAPLKEETP